MFEQDLERLRGAAAKGEFLKCIYEGNNLAETCAAMRLNPAAMAIVRKEDQDFDADIREAQKFRVEILVDKLENIQDHVDDPIMANVVSRNIQWLAGKRYREIYGDKIEHNHNVTINIKEAMDQARQRTLVHVDSQPAQLLELDTDNISVPLHDVACVEVDDIDPLG